jgi:hypothetical protein
MLESLKFKDFISKRHNLNPYSMMDVMTNINSTHSSVRSMLYVQLSNTPCSRLVPLITNSFEFSFFNFRTFIYLHEVMKILRHEEDILVEELIVPNAKDGS